MKPIKYNSDNAIQMYNCYKALDEEGKRVITETYKKLVDYIKENCYCVHDDDKLYTDTDKLQYIAHDKEFNWCKSYNIVIFALFMNRIVRKGNMYSIQKQW